MKIALAQILATKDVQQNLQTVREYAERAKGRGASCVVFPEATMVAFGGRLYDDVVPALPVWEAGVRQVAREVGITVVAGFFSPEPSTDPDAPRVKNQLAVVAPDGGTETYTKIHLYDALGFKESDGVSPGDHVTVAMIDGVKVGLALCYDVRFPKLFAELSRAGAQVIVVPASWAAGEGKVEQWQLLTSVRALDSNCFVVAVDQAYPRAVDPEADVDGPFGVGYSRVVSPFGKTIAELGEAPGLEVVELDLGQVRKAKESLPVIENAKLGY